LVDVSGNQIHYWEVRARLKSGGSAVVHIGDLHAMLKGQKLVGETRFDGLVTVEDTYTPFTKHRVLAPVAESFVLNHQIGVDPNLHIGQNYTAWSRHRAFATYTESVDITTEEV
jgi:hypothetical protein